MKTTTIKLPNGKTAVSFVGEDSTQQAIVHLPTLLELVSNLELITFEEARDKLIRNLMGLDNLEQLVEHIENTAHFHRSVNLIKLYQPTDLTDAEKAALIGDDITEGIGRANKAMAGAIDDL